MEFKLARHLTWRPMRPEDAPQCSDPSYDEEYLRNRHGAYTVIVPVSRCEIEGGYITRESLDAAKCLPFSGWSRTNMVYGNWRKQTRGRYVWLEIDDERVTADDLKYRKLLAEDDPDVARTLERGLIPIWFDTYWTRSVYWVEDNRVYYGTSYRYEEPKRKAA
jgi:hypothetical protein